MTVPSVPLDLASLYLAGWELRLNQLPIEEYIIDIGRRTQHTVARAPIVMQICRGDTIAATFRLVGDEYDADGVLELTDAIRRTKADRS